MKKEILKIAGVKSEKEFYKKFPTEEAFMKMHGKAFRKAQIGTYIGGDKDQGFQPVGFKDILDEADYAVTGSTQDMRDEKEYQSLQNAAAQKELSDKGSAFDQLGSVLGKMGQSGAIGKNGKRLKKAQSGIISMPDPSKITQADLDINAQFEKEAAGGGGGKALNAATKGIPYVGELVQGFQMAKAEKQALNKARQSQAVSDIALKASQTRPEQTQRRYVRPEDNVNTGQAFFPVFGVGTNPLGQAKNGTEIANTFAPNTLYDDLGYEPLDDSERLKQFYMGGRMPKAASGFLADFADAGGGDALSGVVTAIGGENSGGKLGGTIGKGIGTAVAGPVGGMIGQVGGQIIGGLLNRKPAKTRKANAATQQNIQTMALNQGVQGMQQQNASFMKDGGEVGDEYKWISHEWQPQKIVKFGEHSLKDLLKPPADAEMLRAGGHLKEYTPPSEASMSTERPMMEEGGELQTHWGGYAEPMSYNPYLPEDGETVMFRGQSHDESDGKGNTGIGITYGDNPVEVERGEPAIKMKDGGNSSSLVVFGNLKIPHTLLGDPNAKGKNFKRYVAELSEKEKKQNKLMEKSLTQLDDLDVQSPFDRLKFNSLESNIMGANMNFKDIAQKKMDASALQTAMNDTVEEYGLETSDKGTIVAKKGIKIPKAQAGVYKKKATAPGFIDYNPLGTDAVEDFKNKDTYEKIWLPKVESAFSNKETAEKLVDRLENYKGQDAEDVVNLIKKGRTLDEKIKIAKKYASDYKPGPYHELVKGLITTTTTPTTTIAPPTTRPTAPPVVTTTPTTTLAPTDEKKKLNWMSYFNQVLPFLRPSDAEALDPEQLMGEMFALSQNQLEPVQAQLYQPELSVPYDISLQDIMNENEAAFRAQQRTMGYNPAAQSQLAAQKYAANQKVLGEQFRMNQAMKDQIYRENRSLLNDAKLKNLGILDQQYQRQAQAKSNTKATAQEALNSIASKYAQNKLENRTLQVYENMYNYRYDPKFRAMNMNPLVDFQEMIENASPTQLSEIKTAVEKKASKTTSRNGSIVKALKNI